MMRLSGERHSALGRKERTATVPSTTIDELETGAELELVAAQKRRTKTKLEIQAIIDQAGKESRSTLTPDEDSRVTALLTEREAASADVDGVQAKLVKIRKLKAAETETATRMHTTESTGAQKPAYDQVARVGREERTYNPDVDRKGAGFLRDVIRKHFFNDGDANDRLTAHMHEETIERSQYLQRAVGTGGFAGLVVPQYLTDMYAPAVAALRPFADICNHHDLPASGMTVNISRITTPTGVALQATENTSVQNTDMDDTLLTENIQTAAGQQTVSRQAAERGTGIEEVVMDDLFRRYASTLDSTLLNQTTTGLANVATAIQYDDGNPSGVEAWPKLLAGAAQAESALLGFAQPDVVLMHSRRWYWLQSQMSSQWPLFGQPNIANNAGGENYAVTYGRGARGILPNGMAAVVDNNVATNLGTGTNQDEMYVIATDECHLWEDPAAPVFLRAEQPAAANLGILMILYGYFAYSFRRYPTSFARITGTGLTTPVF
jgi:HK97 family phage major capsid protein